MQKNYIIAICCVVAIIIAFILFRRMRTENFIVSDLLKKTSNLFKKIKTENFVANDSDTLVLYYSPHCPHCHSFMPIWDEFSATKKIPTKKVDCTKDACPNIAGYPTVLLQKKDGKTVTFSKNRTVKDLTSFIDENK